MDYQTYTNNVQNIMQMYENLIKQAMTDNNVTRVEILMAERDEKLDELRGMYFSEAYRGNIINLEQED